MPKPTAKQIKDARDLVRVRDGHRCQLCGGSVLNVASSIHHRRPKGMGGSALYETPSNLVRLCGTDNSTGCHGWVERNRDRARDLGWLIRRLSPVSPADVPLLTYLGWVLLDDNGNRTPCDRPWDYIDHIEDSEEAS